MDKALQDAITQNEASLYAHMLPAPAAQSSDATAAHPPTVGGMSVKWLTKSDGLSAHTHEIMHQGAVLIGEVRVRIGSEWEDAKAPWIKDLPANIEHEAQVAEGCEKALWVSIFPEQVGGS